MLAGWVLVVAPLLAGCQPTPGGPTPQGTGSPTVGVSPSATPTPSPTPTTDLTRPSLARRMVDRLLAAAGSDRLIMVEITADTASISVLDADAVEPVTWAYRDGTVQEVTSDLQYVDQATFSIDDFDISDLGRLFRVAAAISGSTQSQRLQIVDYSGGRVVMAVTTNPESRTVFFDPDGRLLPELDYHTESGVADGLDVVLKDRITVQRVGVDSSAGAWVEYRATGSTTVHRQRPAKVPVTTVTRDEVLDLTGFAVGVVDPRAIWRVVERETDAAELLDNLPWSVTIDDREDTGVPQMYFTIGVESFTTDLAGNRVTPR